jgi:hypothetical protein
MSPSQLLTAPDKSGYRTSSVLGLHFSAKRVYQALADQHGDNPASSGYPSAELRLRAYDGEDVGPMPDVRKLF